MPSPVTYHGMFAHVHATQKGYFAHGGAWYELVNKELNGRVGTGTESYFIDRLVSTSTTATSLNVTGVTTFPNTGKVLIGTATEGHVNADDLTVATTGTTGITIRSGDTSNGNIYFSDATSGGGEYAGQIEYLHSADRFTIYAGVSAIMRIHSDKVDVLGHTETDTLNASGVITAQVLEVMVVN